MVNTFTYKIQHLLTQKLTEIKEHINEKHRKDSPAHYTFSYWIVNSKDRSEKEIAKKLISIDPKAGEQM